MTATATPMPSAQLRWEHPIELRLRAAMARFFAVDATALRPGTTLRGELAHGLDLTALGVVLDSELDVQIPDWALERMRTYADLARTVRIVIWARETKKAA